MERFVYSLMNLKISIEKVPDMLGITQSIIPSLQIIIGVKTGIHFHSFPKINKISSVGKSIEKDAL